MQRNLEGSLQEERPDSTSVVRGSGREDEDVRPEVRGGEGDVSKVAVDV